MNSGPIHPFLPLTAEVWVCWSRWLFRIGEGGKLSVFVTAERGSRYFLNLPLNLWRRSEEDKQLSPSLLLLPSVLK